MKGFQASADYLRRLPKLINPTRAQRIDLRGNKPQAARWLLPKGTQLQFEFSGLHEAGQQYVGGLPPRRQRDADLTVRMQLPQANRYRGAIAAPIDAVLKDLATIHEEVVPFMQREAHGSSLARKFSEGILRMRKDTVARALQYDHFKAERHIKYLRGLNGGRGTIKLRHRPGIDARLRVRVLPDPLDVMTASSSNRFGPFETLAQGRPNAAPRFGQTYRLPPPLVDPNAWRSDLRSAIWASAVKGKPRKDQWVIERVTGLTSLTSDAQPWNRRARGSTMYLQCEVPADAQAVWFGPGADLNGSGFAEVRPSPKDAEPGAGKPDELGVELGPMICVGQQDAKGRQLTLRLSRARKHTGRIPSGPACRFVFTIDLEAADGHGTGSLYYSRADDAAPEWLPVEGLLQVPLGLDVDAEDGSNPARWSCFCVRFAQRSVGRISKLEAGWLR